MRRRVATTLFLVLAAAAFGDPRLAFALGGHDMDPSNQVSADSARCQKAIAKQSVRFTRQIVKAISRCFDAVLRCDLSSDGGEQVECLADLLVYGRGRCAAGVLDEGFPYLGETTSAATSASDPSIIGRGLYQFKTKLGGPCLTAGVDLSPSGTGLGVGAGLGSPNDVADALNSGVDGRGVACTAHRLVRDAYPLMDEIIDLLRAQPDLSGAASATSILDYEGPPYGDCK